jgi:outer membrane protein
MICVDGLHSLTPPSPSGRGKGEGASRNNQSSVARLCCLGLVFVLMVTHPAFAVEVPPAGGMVTVQPLTGPASQTNQPTQASDTTALPTLTLEAVWQQVEANHPELAQAVLKQRIAQANLLEKQGAFDPSLTADPFYQRYNSSSKRGTEGEGFGASTAAEMLTRYGAKVSVGAAWNRNDVKSPASATGNAGTYSVGLDIPLLRGARINEKALAEKAAAIKIPLTGADVQAKRLELLTKASKGYWDWWAAHQKTLVGQEVLTLAQQRRAQVVALARAGDVPTIDIAETDLAIQQRQGALAGYQQEAAAAGLELARYLWVSPDKAADPPQASQVPTLATVPTLPDEAELAQQMTQAIEGLPQFAQLRFQKELVALDKALAENLRLPGLNVYVKPGIDIGKQSVGPVLTAGISLFVPLRNRTAEGKLAAARWSLAQLDSVGTQQVQTLVVGVGQAMVAARQALAQWEAARQEVAFAQTLESGERQRYQLGDSTLFLLNTREQASATARLKVIEAEKNYRSSLTQLSVLLKTN